MAKGPSQVALIGSYPPRRCGIATFTSDLYHAISGQQKSKGRVYTLAMNDAPGGYPYESEVRLEIRENVLDDYRMASSFLNINGADAVILQHEYGIFGGDSGKYILRTMGELRMPALTTLHTILQEPKDEQRDVMSGILELSERVVVMSERGVDMITGIYGFPREKVVLIPHGIPDVPFVDPNFYKDKFGVEGRKVLLTFGLLSPGKGIEYVIQALPDITAKFPEVSYLVLGVTHPHVKKAHGEEYRLSLQRMAEDLGVKDNVFFLNRFVELEELCQCIGAADIYVTPYLKKEQITSGTLSYALGAGKAVVSTPYWHAEELLAEDRGRLVPFQDADAVAQAIIGLLENEIEFNAMRRRAYQYCRDMIWSKVGHDYLRICQEVMTQRATKPRVTSIFAVEGPAVEELPEIDLRHLRMLTDDTGAIQHATYTAPNRDTGYTTDDNARALIVACRVFNLRRDESILGLMHVYLGFLLHAFNEERRRFRNFMAYDRRWLEDQGSEDSHGRAIWAVGQGVGYVKNESIVSLCARLFAESLPTTETFVSPRALSYTLLGIHDYLRKFGGDATVRRVRETLARRLQDQFDGYATDEWPWLEDAITYSNGVLPHALLMSGQWIPDSHMVETGLKSLRWLLDVQTGGSGHLSIVGNDGWYPRDGEKAKFDQQPVEAMVLAHACLEAYNMTQEKEWIDEARRCFHWFLGQNDLGLALYDFETGGCRDGLHPNGVNENQGAESTLAWLLALTALHGARMEKPAEEDEKPSGE